MAKILGASNSEEQQLTTTPSSDQDTHTTPASRSCCGNVAYSVGKNTADTYLKEEGKVSVATQYFNNIEDKKKNNNKGSGDGKNKGLIGTISALFGN
mmetsp:Transcript_30616/g.56126  ORF Transcript_30616/g.56126 Transcript_30616/m.56126 type:complete len:97 (-) Transcript_30616:336-626(-)|eukprot:CAMPEP_0201601784 /NCGR_PEP_ID=MMETSP0492-20130828/2677_1 /ASSEMBLY_ACC=CAM_ASM_000837 /TAXON_ID=420259 /ORGANISM="Thalassiosira gravida, Strain GMp14c1" /LENGTH=96 /DNA_ID=CAMNT_0048065117 /DNA_START=125 /DNA_END=415 /DNA_ORIENTATION=+